MGLDLTEAIKAALSHDSAPAAGATGAEVPQADPPASGGRSPVADSRSLLSPHSPLTGSPSLSRASSQRPSSAYDDHPPQSPGRHRPKHRKQASFDWFGEDGRKRSDEPTAGVGVEWQSVGLSPGQGAAAGGSGGQAPARAESGSRRARTRTGSGATRKSVGYTTASLLDEGADVEALKAKAADDDLNSSRGQPLRGAFSIADKERGSQRLKKLSVDLARAKTTQTSSGNSPITPTFRPHRQASSLPSRSTIMATVAHPSQPTRPPGKEKKIFRSISKFLSGGKSRSKLPAGDNPQPSGPAPPVHPSAQSPPLSSDNASDPLASPNGHGTSTIGGRSEGESASLAESGLSVGADTAASVRALPPRSTAPSVLTRSTSAAGSVANSLGGTYKSEASTKPTTVMSVDSGAGANRIAVVPGTGHSFATAALPPSSSAGSITNQQGSSSTPASPNNMTFSSLAPSIPTVAPTSPPPESYPDADGADSLHHHEPEHDSLALSAANVPRHTRADPRNNPHPAYPPPDNASMLTLASSSFAPSFTLARPSHGAGGGGSVAGSGAWSGGGLTGLRAWRDRDGASSLGGGTIDRADEDASVRALVGSRRASDESLGAKSTWSAAVLLNSVGGGSGRAASVLTKGTGGDEDETEAQKVVRHEGDRNLANDHQAIAQALAAAAQPVDHAAPVEVEGVEAEHEVTPTEEKDAVDALPAEGVKTPVEGGATAKATPVLDSTALVPDQVEGTSLPINSDAEQDPVPHSNAATVPTPAAVSDSEDDGVKTPHGAGLSARDRTQSFASGYETATEERDEEGKEVRREELA